jgi:hypothetical protein
LHSLFTVLELFEWHFFSFFFNLNFISMFWNSVFHWF